MPRPPKQPAQNEEVLSLESLDALIERIAAFIEADPDLSKGGQKERAAGIGLKHQKDYSRLLTKTHAPTLKTLNAIAEKMQIPVWKLVMPLSAERALRAVGADVDSSASQAESKKSNHKHTPVRAANSSR